MERLSAHFSCMKEKLRQPYFIYLMLISLVGAGLTVVSIIDMPNNRPTVHYLLFLALAILSQIATTSATISSQAGITYSIVSAVSMATVFIFGPLAAILVESFSTVSAWLITPPNQTTWKRSWQQLGFNNGMSVIAIWGAGSLFLFLQNSLPDDTLLAEIVPWLFAAIIYDQLNLWLLIGILRFQHGREFKIRQFWRENSWSTPMMFVISTIGGATLAFSSQQFGVIGILIFFLPVFLSAYAVRLYIRQMQNYMNDLENVVEERTQELVALSRRKDQFLAVLGHDMKLPLTTIKLYIETLIEQPDVIEKKPHFLETILYGQQTLVDMVNNMLDLERLESGHEIELYKEAFDLRLLTKTVVTLLQIQAHRKEITIEMKHKVSEPFPIKADIQQIERVIMNLLSNAIKYSPRQGHVAICVEPVGDTAVIAVSDSGYGIPEESLPYVFDRFHRVEKLQNKAAGTGLGLAICKALVEAHDGQIIVASEEGKGSTFTVILPIATSAISAPRAATVGS